MQPSTPLDSTPDVIPPEFTPNPALSTANVDSSCPTIKSVNLEESNKGGLKSESIFGWFLHCQKKGAENYPKLLHPVCGNDKMLIVCI